VEVCEQDGISTVRRHGRQDTWHTGNRYVNIRLRDDCRRDIPFPDHRCLYINNKKKNNDSLPNFPTRKSGRAQLVWLKRWARNENSCYVMYTKKPMYKTRNSTILLPTIRTIRGEFGNHLQGTREAAFLHC